MLLSQINWLYVLLVVIFVSILVVMDVALAVMLKMYSAMKLLKVSILVVMDVALAVRYNHLSSRKRSLNPCCNGCCSRSPCLSYGRLYLLVSILVVMDVALADTGWVRYVGGQFSSQSLL